MNVPVPASEFGFRSRFAEAVLFGLVGLWSLMRHHLGHRDPAVGDMAGRIVIGMTIYLFAANVIDLLQWWHRRIVDKMARARDEDGGAR